MDILNIVLIVMMGVAILATPFAIFSHLKSLETIAKSLQKISEQKGEKGN